VPDLTITGQVVEVDTVGTISQGVVSYTVKVGFDTQDDRIKPAMSVSAAIVTETKPDVLLVPNSAIHTVKSQTPLLSAGLQAYQTSKGVKSLPAQMEQGGMSYVEIVEGNDRNLALAPNAIGVILKNPPRRQVVEVGAANDEFTEIVSGLNEGDVVVVRTIQPTTTQSTQQQSSGLRIPGLNTGGGGSRR